MRNSIVRNVIKYVSIIQLHDKKGEVNLPTAK